MGKSARTRSCAALGALLWSMLGSRRALAGGWEIPDNGTEALGRGAAFVAKASDPTAIYYNPAGLARQRGTQLVIDESIYLHSFAFQRAGTYPDDPQDPATPWGNAPFPTVRNTAGPFVQLPFIAVATDLGYFDRVTFGAGIFSPPIIGNRTFPLGVDNKPAPSRYDFVQSQAKYYFPTLAAGFRVTKTLDVGVSAHLVLANVVQTSVYYADNPDDCKNAEFFKCDSRNTLVATGTSFGATIGAMFRPLPVLGIGASLVTPVTVNASGTDTPQQPEGIKDALNPGPATYAFQLPLMARLGGRYVGLDADFEVYDLELDFVYEGWGTSQRIGPIVTLPDLGAFTNVQAVQFHGYNNTFGIRGGGAYNIEVGDGNVLTLRGGAYYDSSSTGFQYTRIDYDTLAKIAGTFGIGYKVGSFSFNLAYAAVASIPRVVGSGIGQVGPINGLQGGKNVGSDGKALEAVNEGAYRGFTNIVSLGLTVAIDSFFGPPRKFHYGNSYEPNYVDENAPKPDSQKGDESKPESEKKGDEKKGDEKKGDEKKGDEKKGDEKKGDEKKGDEKKGDEKKGDEKKGDEKKGDRKKPDDIDPKKIVVPPPPSLAPPGPPPPPPPPPEKPASKRKEWWEEGD